MSNKNKRPVLTSKHLTALRQAVRQAKDWRGSLVGHDGTPSTMRDEDIRLDAFDLMAAEWDKALKAVSQAIKTNKLRRAVARITAASRQQVRS